VGDGSLLFDFKIGGIPTFSPDRQILASMQGDTVELLAIPVLGKTYRIGNDTVVWNLQDLKDTPRCEVVQAKSGFEMVDFAKGSPCEVWFNLTVANAGRDAAYRLVADVKLERPEIFSKVSGFGARDSIKIHFGTIAPGQEVSRRVKFTLDSDENLFRYLQENKGLLKSDVQIAFTEAHEYPPNAVSFAFLADMNVTVAEASLKVHDQLSVGENITATLKVQNQGAARYVRDFKPVVAWRKSDGSELRRPELSVGDFLLDREKEVSVSIPVDQDLYDAIKSQAKHVVTGFGEKFCKADLSVPVRYDSAMPNIYVSYLFVEREGVSNGDGLLQPRESGEVLLFLRNTSQLPLQGVKWSFAPKSKESLDIWTATEGTLDFQAGHLAKIPVKISLKSSFSKDSLSWQLKLEHAQAGVLVNDELVMPVDVRGQAEGLVAAQRSLQVVTEGAVIRGGASDKSGVLGNLKRGVALVSSAIYQGFYRVRIQMEESDEIYGWVSQQDVEPTSVSAENAAGVEKIQLTGDFAPVVRVVHPPSREWSSNEEKIRLEFEVLSEIGVDRVDVELNGVKACTMQAKDLGGGTEAKVLGKEDRAGSGQPARLDRDIPLELGENLVAIRAYDRKGQQSTAQIRIQRVHAEGSVYALVVGIERYQSPAIPQVVKAENDAASMSEFFRGSRSPVPASHRDESHIKTLVSGEAGKGAMEQGLQWLAQNARERLDTAVFYFSGHGFSVPQDQQITSYYLAPADVQANVNAESKLSPVSQTALSLDEVQKLWSRIPCQRKIFICDCCYAGGFVHLRNLEGMFAGRGSVVLLSSQDDERSAAYTQEQNGLYTHYLLKGLQGEADGYRCAGFQGIQDNRVTVSELSYYVHNEVAQAAKNRKNVQNPTQGITGEMGSFVFGVVQD
jgi:hypothetical protein